MTIYSGQIDENVTLSQADQCGLATITGDLLNMSQVMDGIRAQSGEIDENLTLSPALATLYAITMLETIAIDQAETVNGHYNLSIAEQAFFYSNIISTLPAEIDETITITASQDVQLALTVIEALQLTDVITPAIMYHMQLDERLSVADVVLKFFAAQIDEVLSITPAIDAEAFLAAQINETLSIADVITPQFLLHVECDETLELTASQAVNMLFSAEIDETIKIAGAYLAPNGSITTWAMNTRTAGVTEYQNYAFNSFARVGDKYLGAADDGLYELLGDTDNGTSIIATIRSGFAQWAGTHLGSFKAAYLAVAGPGNYILRVITRDGKTFNYEVNVADGRTAKIKMGKGLRSRYFAFELVSTGQDFDLDTLEFFPLVADRRV